MIAMKLKKYAAAALLAATLTGCEKIGETVPADVTVPDVSLTTMGTLSEDGSEPIAEYETEAVISENQSVETANSEEITEPPNLVEAGGEVDELSTNAESTTPIAKARLPPLWMAYPCCVRWTAFFGVSCLRVLLSLPG